MPTDPLRGFFLVPVGMREDDHLKEMDLETRGLWLTVMLLGYDANRTAISRGDGPCYEFNASLADLAHECNEGSRSKISRLMNRLVDAKWVEQTAAGQVTDKSRRRRGQVVTRYNLTKAPIWQDFKTFRGHLSNKSRTPAGHLADNDAPARARVHLPTTITTTTEAGKSDQLFPDAKGIPPEAYALADRHRALILEYQGNGARVVAGIKRDNAWANKRNLWANQYRQIAIDMDEPISFSDQSKALEGAFASERTWAEDRGHSWRAMLSRGNPAEAFKQKIHKIRGQLTEMPKPREFIPDNDFRRIKAERAAEAASRPAEVAPPVEDVGEMLAGLKKGWEQ